MAQMDDGYIFQLGNIFFNQKQIGYVSEEGLVAGGDAPSTTQVRAAQLANAVVKTLLTTPGVNRFTFTLIQLLGENIKDVFGGTVDPATGDYTAPRVQAPLEGKLLIAAESGHKLIAQKVSLTANFANSVSLANTLAIACTLEILMPETGEPFKILTPASTLDISGYLPVEG